MSDEANSDQLSEIESKRARLICGGGADAIEKQHLKGKLTAWERMEILFDRGTFQELNLWAKPLKTGFDIDSREIPRDALVTGYGKIQGRFVYAFSYDFTIAGGSQAAIQMAKLGNLMEQAREQGYPLVGIIDSAGRRIQDFLGRWGFRPPVRISGCDESALDMFCPPMASGVIPQVSLMLGPCYAGTAYSPMMSDFMIFRKGASFMSVASPALLKSATFVDVTEEEIGGATLHATTTGSCDILAESDEEALNKCRELLSFLPLNWREKPPFMPTQDAPNRREEKLLELATSVPSQSYDIHNVINLVTDDGYFFELKPLYAQNIVIGFARLMGRVVGIVANNPTVNDGSLDANTCDKAAHFIRTCDAFNIPLIFMVDTPGFLPSVEQEQSREGLERHVAKPVFAICESTVPKITVYLGKCYGTSRLVMGTKEMGIDTAFGWPGAELIDVKSLLRLLPANKAGEAEKLKALAEEFAEPYHSAGTLAIDEIIDPRDTRPALITALERLSNKQEPVRPSKKYGLIPL